MNGMLLGWVFIAATVTVARAQDPERVSTDYGGSITFQRDKGITTGIVPGKPDTVYQRLRQVSKDMGLVIKPGNENVAGREYLIDKQRLVRQLGKKQISAYLSCGDGLTGPNADSWYVYLTVRSKVGPAPKGDSTVELALTADAVDVPGGRNDRVVCASNGRLENEIIKRVQLAAAQAQ